MAFIDTSVYSNVLRQDIHLDLFLPNDRPEHKIRKPRGIVYFLHGLGSSEKQFREYTATNRYARDNHLAIVYVSAPQSFYSDMKYGLKYYTYITEELPELLSSLYGLSFPREKTFLAGLSMGGYGTLKIGLSRPDMFGAIAPFSAPCDIHGMADAILSMDKIEGDNASFIPVFGEKFDIDDGSDPYLLLKKVSELPQREQPRILMMCGKQDDLANMYDQNVAFNEYAKTLPLADFSFKSWNGGHDYTFWDRAMLHAVSFFLKNGYDKKKIELWRCEAD